MEEKEVKLNKLKGLEWEMSQVDFWSDKNKAQATLKKITELKNISVRTPVQEAELASAYRQLAGIAGTETTLLIGVPGAVGGKLLIGLNDVLDPRAQQIQQRKLENINTLSKQLIERGYSMFFSDKKQNALIATRPDGKVDVFKLN
jgi:hypothetical protein